MVAAQTAGHAEVRRRRPDGSVGDAISATVTPAYTAALTNLASTLTSSGATLATLTTAVANTSTTTVSGMPPAASGTPSLPADLVLRTAASNCSALRSGSYRIVLPPVNTPLAGHYGTIVINAGHAWRHLHRRQHRQLDRQRSRQRCLQLFR